MYSAPSRRNVVAVCCFILLLVAAPSWGADESPAWEEVTVVTVAGESHENVTLRWVLDGFSLSLTAPDGRIVGLSPSEVVAVRGAGGEDLTQAVADSCPAEGITFALLGAERVVPLGFRWMVGAGVTGSLLNGDADFLIDGALHAGLRRRLCSWSHLNVMYRRQRIIEDMGGLRGIADTHSDEVHLLIGSRMTHPRRNNNFVYLEVGPSLVRFEKRWVGYALVSSEKWNLAGTLRAGAVYPVGDRFGLDLGMIFMMRPGVLDGSGVAESMFGVDLALAARW